MQVAATNFITELGAKHTEQMKLCLPLIVPVLSGAVADSKLQVKVPNRRPGGTKHELQLYMCHAPAVSLCAPAKVTLTCVLQEASINALRATCKTVGNKDVDPFIPVLIDSIAKPSEVAECVHKLSATTFVQVSMTATKMLLQLRYACGRRTHLSALMLKAVEAPTLAMLVPLLVRGMAERQTAIKRKTAVITDNMAKLVDDPVDAAVFLPRLLPGECV